MAKLYTKRKQFKKEVKPNKETINFILNYSKALKIIRVSDQAFENILN